MNKVRYVLNYSKAIWDGLCSYLLLMCVSNLQTLNSFGVKSSQLSMKLCARIFLKTYQNPPWFNSSIRHHLNCVRTLRRKYKRHPSEIIKVKIDSCETALNKEMSFT